MLRRAKSVDIPFMVKGYEIGLRDGNFSESKMQINAFFANTTTHKNVHSYIYEHKGAVAGYAILRKKDAARHEIMMMFVDPAQQGNGIGKQFFGALLSGPMKDSPILCSTTQPASTRMMALLKSGGFQRKIEADDGVYWEKPNGAGAAAAPAPTPAPAKAQPLSGMAQPPRLALPMPLLLPPAEQEAETSALEQATQVSHRIPAGYRPAPPPIVPPPVIEGVATELAAGPAAEAALETASPVAESIPVSPEPPPAEPDKAQGPSPEPVAEAVPVVLETAPASQPAADAPKTENATKALPKPPADFSGKANLSGSESRQQRAKQLAKELFETLKWAEVAPETPAVQAVAPSSPDPEALPAPLSSEEDIPLLATLNVVREKMGALPGVKLPPIDRYSLMEFNKKDLENMNVVELAALSAQLIKLAKDQLEEIDRLKIASKKRR